MDKPPDGVNLDELSALESKLASLEGELYAIRGTASSNLGKEKVGGATDVFLHGRPEEREFTLPELLRYQQTADLTPFTVFKGQLLAAQPAGAAGIYEFKVAPGSGVIVADNGQRFFAAVNGVVRWSETVVAVEPLLTVADDLGPGRGLLETEGSVRVAGNVSDGAMVRAGGDIYVAGNVGQANLSAGGDIIVRSGVTAQGGGLLRAGGTILARSADQANLEAGGDVIVADGLRNSRVYAAKRIIVAGEKGAMIGGEARAGEAVITRLLGSAAGAETAVAAGTHAAVKPYLAELNRQREAAGKQRAALAARAAPPDPAALKAREQEDQQLALTERELQAVIRETEAAAAAEESGRVIVTETAHPAARIVVGHADPLLLSRELAASAFTEKKKKVIPEAAPAQLKLKAIPRRRRQEEAAATAAPAAPADLARLRRCLRLAAPSAAEAAARGALYLGLAPELVQAFPAEAGEKGQSLAHLAIQLQPGEDPAAVIKYYLPPPRKTEIEITCETIEAGVKKGAAALNKPVAEVQYKIVQEKSKGLLGVGQKPYIIRVTVKAEKKAKTKGAPPASAIAAIANEEDGRFTLENTDGGLILAVFPAKGNGKKVELDQVKMKLIERSYKRGIDMKLVAQAVKEATAENTRIAERQPDPETDGRIELEVSEDRLTAWATVYAAKPGGKPLTLDDAIRELQAQKIAKPDLKTLEAVYTGGKFGEKLPIAQGVPPVEGQDGHWEFKVNLDRETVHIKENEQGQADFRELNKVENVTEGQLLAVKTPSVAGIPGIDVRGQEIAVKSGKEQPLTAGRNTRVSDDGKEIFASLAGQAMLIGRALRVEPVYYVHADVDFNTGNINFFGNVVVKGTVREGFTVRAAGDIICTNVEKAVLEAENDIIIRGGAIGSDTTALKAGRDIRAKFVESAHLAAGRDIVIQEMILHSQLNAGRMIRCREGKKGCIIGGTARAADAIVVKELGSKAATRTVAEVGIDPVARQQIAELERELEGFHANFKKVHLGIKALVDARAKAGALPPAKLELLAQLQSVAGQLQGRLRKAEVQMEELQQKLKESATGMVAVAERAYAGCKITVRNASLNIDKDVQFSSFIYEQGEVRVTPYEDVKFKDDDAKPAKP